MESLYEQIGQYMVTCVDDKETLDLMIKELMPLMKQINYSALTADDLQQTTDKLGLGDQALVILSNIVTIYKVNMGMDTSKLLTLTGLEPAVIAEIQNDLSLVWIPAGILLLGSGILSKLRDTTNANDQ